MPGIINFCRQLSYRDHRYQFVLIAIALLNLYVYYQVSLIDETKQGPPSNSHSDDIDHDDRGAEHVRYEDSTIYRLYYLPMRSKRSMSHKMNQGKFIYIYIFTIMYNNLFLENVFTTESTSDSESTSSTSSGSTEDPTLGEKFDHDQYPACPIQAPFEPKSIHDRICLIVSTTTEKPPYTIERTDPVSVWRIVFVILEVCFFMMPLIGGIVERILKERADRVSRRIEILQLGDLWENGVLVEPNQPQQQNLPPQQQVPPRVEQQPAARDQPGRPAGKFSMSRL